MVGFRTTLLSAGDISSTQSILVYNTNSFSSKKSKKILDNNKIEGLDYDLLSNSPTRSNIVEISKILLGMKDLLGSSVYQKVKNESGKYTITLPGILGADGFNTIIFYTESGSIIGFSRFSETLCNKVDNTDESEYTIKRLYSVDSIILSIDVSGKIIFEQDKVSLLDNISNEDVSRLTSNLLGGDDGWKFTRAKDAYDSLSTYSPRQLYSTELKGNNLFTDKFFEKNDSCYKINMKSLIVMNTSFTNYQIGFLDLDIVLYCWNLETLEFCVVSLIKSNKFGGNYYYTEPVSEKYKTEIHKLSVEEEGKIVGFSGPYLYFKPENRNNTCKVFNFLTDSWITSGDYFILSVGLKNDIYKVSDDYGFSSYQDAIKKIPLLDDMYFNIKVLSNISYLNVIGILEGWAILYDSKNNTFIASNSEKVLFFGEPDFSRISFINGECILVRKSSLEYQFITSKGYYITDYQKDYLISVKGGTDDLCKYIDDGKKEINTLSTTKIESPINIEKSNFSYFRRNYLPRSINDFKVICSGYGFIFYKRGNIISYL